MTIKKSVIRSAITPSAIASPGELIRCISVIEQIWAKRATIMTFQINFKSFALFCLTRILATKESGHQKNLFVDLYDVFLDRFFKNQSCRAKLKPISLVLSLFRILHSGKKLNALLNQDRVFSNSQHSSKLLLISEYWITSNFLTRACDRK